MAVLQLGQNGLAGVNILTTFATRGVVVYDRRRVLVAMFALVEMIFIKSLSILVANGSDPPVRYHKREYLQAFKHCYLQLCHFVVPYLVYDAF